MHFPLELHASQHFPMGICLSCVGVRQQASDVSGSRYHSPESRTHGPKDETSRLLPDDPYQSQYGSANDGARLYFGQPRKERTDLRRLCAKVVELVIVLLNTKPTSLTLLSNYIDLSPSFATQRGLRVFDQSPFLSDMHSLRREVGPAHRGNTEESWFAAAAASRPSLTIRQHQNPPSTGLTVIFDDLK